MGLRCKNIFGKMVIYIDDEGMKMEDGGEMDLLYREEGREDERDIKTEERGQ